MKLAQPFLDKLKSIYFPKEKTILALSGGPDSVALLYLLIELKKEMPDFYFEAYHLNHQLRGLDSENDAQFVKTLCEQEQIQFHSYKENVKTYSLNHKLSLEEAGREIRYEHLRQIKNENHFDSITTAHHLDDQMELFFMRLFKGAGLEALSGMKERLGYLVRPLLTFSKEKILNWLRENQLAYQIDHTNQDDFALRNKIRNHLIPEIVRIFPNYSEKIRQFQEILEDQHQIAQDHLINWESQKYQVWMDLKDFIHLGINLRKDQLMKGLKQLSKNYYLSFNQLKDIEKKIESWDGSGHKIMIEKKQFKFMGTQNKLFFVDFKFYEGILDDFDLKPHETKNFDDFALQNLTDKTFFLRKPKPGEFIEMNHKRKINDYLTDLKIFYHWRSKMLAIEAGNGKVIGLFDGVGEKIILNKEHEENITLLSLKAS